MNQPTIMDRYHTAYSAWNKLDFEIRQLAKHRKPVSAELIEQREAAWQQYQAALAEFQRIAAASGRK